MISYQYITKPNNVTFIITFETVVGLYTVEYTVTRCNQTAEEFLSSFLFWVNQIQLSVPFPTYDANMIKLWRSLFFFVFFSRGWAQTETLILGLLFTYNSLFHHISDNYVSFQA